MTKKRVNESEGRLCKVNLSEKKDLKNEHNFKGLVCYIKQSNKHVIGIS